MPYLGEFAALATALCWLGSSLAFAVAGREGGAQALNQFRLYAALPMLALLALAITATLLTATLAALREGTDPVVLIRGHGPAD